MGQRMDESLLRLGDLQRVLYEIDTDPTITKHERQVARHAFNRRGFGRGNRSAMQKETTGR